MAAAQLACLTAWSAARRPRKPVQSPKAAEQSASLGAQMLSRQVALITPSFITLPTRTNFVYKVNLAWLEDPDTQPFVSTYTLYMGRSPGTYDYWTNDIGTNLFYTFARTNWGDERLNRHFFVVTAKDQDGNESLPSNEVHYPPFGPDHYRLTWTSNWDQATIFSSTSASIPRESWQPIATVFSTNTYEGVIDLSVGLRVYCLDKPDVLTITVFNPNP